MKNPKLNNPNGWGHLTTHAVQRTWQRFGREFRNREMKQIVKDIESGNALFIEDVRFGRQKWEVLHRDRLITVIYNPKSKSIITVY